MPEGAAQSVLSVIVNPMQRRQMNCETIHRQVQVKIANKATRTCRLRISNGGLEPSYRHHIQRAIPGLSSTAEGCVQSHAA